MGLLNFTLVILAIALLWQEATSDGTVSVKLVKYTNPKGKGSNGNCCDGIGIICRGKCDHYFLICLDQPSSSSNSLTTCPLGKYTTDQTREMNTITFGSNIGSTPNPKVLNFAGAWPGGVKLKVNVNDFDGSNDNDFVEYLTKTHTQAANGVESSFSVAGRTTLELRLTVSCKANFFGADCGTQCVSGPNYECNAETGVKECRAGWEGAQCDQDIDECANSPCNAEGGNCTDEINGYSCECFLGFHGQNCSEGSPCVCDNGGTCYMDEGGELACECTEEFVGDDCEIPVPKASAAESHVIIKFGEEFSKAEVKAFYTRVDTRAAETLDMGRDNISIYHREFLCEGQDGPFTLMTVDLYTDENHHLNESSALSVMDSVLQNVQGTKEEFEYTELTEHTCELVDVTGDEDDDDEPEKKKFKLWLFWLIFGVGCALMLIILLCVLCCRFCR